MVPLCRYDSSLEKAKLIARSRQVDQSFAFIFRRDLTAVDLIVIALNLGSYAICLFGRPGMTS